jgi:hypothetical protein
MRVLLDECVPRPLKRELSGHEVRTVQECGWAGARNGALLRQMLADGFTVFVTTDRNLQHQQNVAASGVAVVVLVALTNKLPDLLPLVPAFWLRSRRHNPGASLT